MAFALVAHVQAVTSDTNNVTTGTVDTTGAAVIIISVSANSSTYTLSDNKSNTWTHLTDHVLERQHYCINPTVGSGHTFSISSTGQLPALSVLGFSASSTPIFVTETGTFTSASSAQPGTITPATINQVLVTGIAYADTGVATVDSSFTTADTPVGLVGGAHYGVGSAYIIETTAVAKNPTWTQGSSTSIAPAMCSFQLTPTTNGRMFLVF